VTQSGAAEEGGWGGQSAGVPALTGDDRGDRGQVEERVDIRQAPARQVTASGPLPVPPGGTTAVLALLAPPCRP